MPGIRAPYKSRRLLSLSSYWLGYANDAAILTPFGFLFTCTGGLALIAFALTIGPCFLSQPIQYLGWFLVLWAFLLLGAVTS